MSLNAHYMVLFKNPRDASQFANLARQVYLKTSQFAVEAYRDATREPYLLVDLRPEQRSVASCKRVVSDRSFTSGVVDSE